MEPKVWKDEAGNVIPANRITKSEKLRERYTARIVKEAKAINRALTTLKAFVDGASNDIFLQVAKENDIDISKRKGNFTWYNFDHSIKIEININERIAFDKLLINGCKEKLMTFIDNTVTGNEDFVKDLILDAFNTATGKLDTKKVMSLLKYQDRITNPLFKEAMQLLAKSVTRPDSKMYSRVWEKNSEGEYVNIDLNYSSI
jgi:hypothetical protein